MSDESILNINAPVQFNNEISNYELHAHQSFGSTSFDNSDEIRISIQNQDLFVLPSKSYIHISGKLTHQRVAANPEDPIADMLILTLVNNAMCFLFDEMRYELNGVLVDKSKNVGITSTMKNYLSLSSRMNYENAGWINQIGMKLINDDGYFDICVPLKMIFGFAEDYQKIIVNAKHELIMIRSRSNINSIVRDNETVPDMPEFDLKITKIEWLVPYVMLSNKNKIDIMKYIQKDPVISIGFRSWDLYEYPLLPRTTHHIWTVKTATQLEKPRYVILCFQTDRKNDWKKDVTHFDHCKITNIKLYLNSQIFPYGNLNLDIEKNQFSLLYDMYANFAESYYGSKIDLMTKDNFIKKSPLIVIDCSKQNEFLKTGAVDVRLEFESKENFPQGTSAYCLILHDKIIEYRPISGIVHKLT